MYLFVYSASHQTVNRRVLTSNPRNWLYWKTSKTKRNNIRKGKIETKSQKTKIRVSFKTEEYNTKKIDTTRRIEEDIATLHCEKALWTSLQHRKQNDPRSLPGRPESCTMSDDHNYVQAHTASPDWVGINKKMFF